MTDSPQSEDIDDRITDLVEQYWQEHKTPLLLSRLGSHGGGEISRLAKAHSKGLGNYLRYQLADRVQVIKHSANPIITGVVPASATPDTDEEIDALLQKTQHGSSANAPRFHPAFWAAFRKPLEESNRRHLSIDAPIRFQESSGEDPPDGFLEVTGTYITDPGMDDEQTLRKAEQWLADNDLQKDIYLLDSKSKPSSDQPQNLLDRLLFSLENKELNRVSMPLDIVLKLRKLAP